MIESSRLTAGSGPSNHETFTLSAPAELTAHLHSVYSAPTGHKPTYSGNFKTPKEGKYDAPLEGNRKKTQTQDYHQYSKTIQEGATWSAC